MVQRGRGAAAEVEFVPTEEQILKELKQKEMRKKYMTSDKAKVNRKAYQLKRQAERKVLTAAIAKIKAEDPGKYAEMMAKAGVS